MFGCWLVFSPIPGFPGHCFDLRDLFPMSFFFKLVMIMLLKIYVADKHFGEIDLKTIRDIFSSNIWSVIGTGTGGLSFLGEVISSRKEKFKLLVLHGDLYPTILSLSVIS